MHYFIPKDPSLAARKRVCHAQGSERVRSRTAGYSEPEPGMRAREQRAKDLSMHCGLIRIPGNDNDSFETTSIVTYPEPGIRAREQRAKDHSRQYGLIRISGKDKSSMHYFIPKDPSLTARKHRVHAQGSGRSTSTPVVTRILSQACGPESSARRIFPGSMV